jgi:hypothetical protein
MASLVRFFAIFLSLCSRDLDSTLVFLFVLSNLHLHLATESYCFTSSGARKS